MRADGTRIRRLNTVPDVYPDWQAVGIRPVR